MSHFTVLVIGDDVEKQLQPYHEYECTGIEDEYVIDVDTTDEVKEYLERGLFVGPRKDNGKIDDQYYEEQANEYLTEWKKMTRLEYLQSKGLTPEEIEEEIIDYTGFKKKEDGSWYRHTNPNSKWDWWVIGGRWAGFFKMKPGGEGEVGRSGLFGTPPAEEGYVDVVKKKDIDFEGMLKESEDKAAKSYDEVYEVIKDTPIAESWVSIRERIKDIDEARKFYHKQERVVAASGKLSPWINIDDYQVDRDVYIQREKNKTFSTYAIVKDSKWYAKGEMGWWAVSSNEVDQNDWNQKVMELIESVDDETLFTLVDCHI
jgi:hypothetical protein